MIVICGIAHSYTSAIAKFLLDNGGNFGEFREGTFDPVYDYVGYEDEQLRSWTEKKHKFKNVDFPKSDRIAKYPEACYFLDSIPDDVKIIYCLRSPDDLINSHKEKYDRGAFLTLNKYSYVWDVVARARQDVYVLMTERILLKNEYEAKRLLEFCNLPTDKIVFNLKFPNKRGRRYNSYRIHNLIYKILYKCKRD